MTKRGIYGKPLLKRCDKLIAKCEAMKVDLERMIKEREDWEKTRREREVIA